VENKTIGIILNVFSESEGCLESFEESNDFFYLVNDSAPNTATPTQEILLQRSCVFGASMR